MGKSSPSPEGKTMSLPVSKENSGEAHSGEPNDEFDVKPLLVKDSEAASPPSSIEDNIDAQRQYTHEDANSLIGGQQISFSNSNVQTTGDSNGNDFMAQKVFSFSLPFGGLSSFKSGFKLPFTHKEEDQEIKELRLKLERQESINTIEEAKMFASTKSTDDVRFRAMKQSIKENISEFLPEFISKKVKPYESVFQELSGPVVVLGGYRGSILRETGTGKRAWVPLKAGFNLRKIDLLLGPTTEAELRATEKIYPDGVLKNIGPFDICKRFIKKLVNGKTTVVEFGYDWRLSLEISSNQLVECLEKLSKKTNRKVLVIAHSMGGLVAHGALQKRPELFRGLVYTGVPSECLNILGPIRYGDSIMLSDRILTFETNFMMRSSFCFLPLSGRVFANEETGEWYDLDYFNPETWVEYNLNPLVSSVRKQHELGGSPSSLSNEVLVAEHRPTEEHSPSSSMTITSISSRLKFKPAGMGRKHKSLTLTNSQMQKRHASGRSSPSSPMEEDIEDRLSFTFSEAYSYLCDVLPKAKKYMLGLEYSPELEDKYPPLAMVYGNRIPSVRGSYVKSPQDIKDGNYYHFFYGRGDGVVNSRWLMPERKGFTHYDPKTGKGQIVGKISTNAGHVNMMNDLDAMGQALNAIVEAEKNWKK